MTDNSLPRSRIVLDCIYYAVAIFFFLYLFTYFWTSEGGPTLLAMTLVPVTFVLFILSSLRANDLYPRLPPVANYAIAAVYIGCALAVSVYMNMEYYELGTSRAGPWDPSDLFMGGLMAVLVLEYSRKRHMPLFVLNIVLILYAVYGWLVPGMFYHAGLSWNRVVTAMSVENTTGVFSNLPQIALTIIGSFLLVLSVLTGYGCIDSLLRATKRVAVRSPHALPQSAVVGSMCVGTVSGSGAANAITIGSATIPAMIGAGMPRATAAAIESASSLGGQLMPPVMGVSAFLMAEFLGRSYFDVVARGYVPALIYYATVAVSVYLLAVRHRTRLVTVSFEDLTWRDWINLAAFVAVIAGLVALMATWHLPPMFAALYVFVAVGGALFVVNLAALLLSGRWSLRAFIEPIRKFLDTYTEMTADLTLLLATLSIMTGALVITGVPTKLGSLLIEAAGFNLAAMVVLAFVFGALARHRAAARADLYPGRHRDRAADDPRRRRSVGGAFLCVLPRGLGRAHAADVDRGRGDREDRRCVVLRDARAGAADLRLAVHADGGRIHPAGTRGRARIEPADGGAVDPGGDHRDHVQPTGPLRRPGGDRLVGSASARGLCAARAAASERGGGGSRLRAGRADRRLLVAAPPSRRASYRRCAGRAGRVRRQTRSQRRSGVNRRR